MVHLPSLPKVIKARLKEQHNCRKLEVEVKTDYGYFSSEALSLKRGVKNPPRYVIKMAKATLLSAS